MTSRPARHAAKIAPGKGGLYVGRLLVLLGAAAFAYVWALSPVLASLRTTAERDARQAALEGQVTAAAKHNRELEAQLRQDEQALQRDTRQESSLRTALAALRREKPPAPAVSPNVGSVAMPTVQTTTGASGIP